MSKQFTVQFGSAKPEQVDEAGLALLKSTYGQAFSGFTVKEVAAPAPKPADITKAAPAAEGKKPKAE